MTQIIPSLLVSSEQEFKTQIESLKNATEMIQIDLADGKFVPNTTWTFTHPKEAQKYLNNIDFELHLMVSDPLKTAQDWIKLKKLKRILVHFESSENLAEILSELKKSKKQIGVVLKPDTSLTMLIPYLDEIDTVMFMGVNPGFQGQKFIPDTLQKIKDFKSMDTGHFTEIDGAVNMETLPQIVKTKIDAVCPGSAIFGNDNTPAKNIMEMKKEIKRLTGKK